MRSTMRDGDMPNAHELMNMHAEAMFTYDDNHRLRMINEPWPGSNPAPRFFLGRTYEGTAIWRFRNDVPESLIQQLERLCADEPHISDFHARPKHFETYMSLLQAERFTMGPCYAIPETCVPTSKAQAISITTDNIGAWDYSGFEWLSAEIAFAKPCIAIVHDTKIVSICRSVRISPNAHEAGLETLAPFRGKGYAARAVAGWAQAVRATGAVPMYSTFCDNLSSQRVAAKSSLSVFGVNFTIK